MASDSYIARGGAVASVSAADWARAPAQRVKVNWLPRAAEPVVAADGTLTGPWRRFFEEITRRLDGIQGRSVAELGDSVDLVQSGVLEAQTAATSAQAATLAQAASIDAIREVAVNAGLPGAGNIP